MYISSWLQDQIGLEPSDWTGGADQCCPVLMLEHCNAWTPYWSSSSTRPPLPAQYLLFQVIFLSLRHDDCMRARGCLVSGKADRLLWLEVRWINVSALLWCRACFSIACLWLIKHIDWAVSGLEGWPTAAPHGTTSLPFLSLSWRLKGEGNTGWNVMSAQ